MVELMLPFTCGPVPVKSNSTLLLLPCGGTVMRSLIGMLVVPTPSSSITSSKVYSPGAMRAQRLAQAVARCGG